MPGAKQFGGLFCVAKAIAPGNGRNSARLRAEQSLAFAGRFLVLSSSPIAERGALAQLGEHLLCKQRVIGSIPIGSTKPSLRRAGAYRLWG